MVGWVNHQYIPLQFRVIFHSVIACCWYLPSQNSLVTRAENLGFRICLDYRKLTLAFLRSRYLQGNISESAGKVHGTDQKLGQIRDRIVAEAQLFPSDVAIMFDVYLILRNARKSPECFLSVRLLHSILSYCIFGSLRTH